jgi:hypothetical protein
VTSAGVGRSGWYSLNSMPSPQEFVENWPLYTKAGIKNFSPPKSITSLCSTCKKETTWGLAASQDLTRGAIFSFAAYECGLCQKQERLLVLYRVLDYIQDKSIPVIGEIPYTPQSVQKIGQIPPQTIDIPTSLEERLGHAATYYKHALVCRSQNFGIAAVAYMRRVVEEKTDELIDVVVALAGTSGVDAKTIEAMAKAKDQIQYENKVKVASEVIPDALKPEDVNPFGQLHKHLSVGVHGKTDDECIAVFDELRADFEYVFRNLYVQAREAKEFAQRVQQRAGRNK